MITIATLAVLGGLAFAYLRVGFWFRNVTAEQDALKAREEWYRETSIRESFTTRQTISLTLWPFKMPYYYINNSGIDRWTEYDPVARRERDRRIQEQEREHKRYIAELEKRLQIRKDIP